MRLASVLKQSGCTVEFYSIESAAGRRTWALVVNGLRLKDAQGVGRVFPDLGSAWVAARKAIVS